MAGAAFIASLQGSAVAAGVVLAAGAASAVLHLRARRGFEAGCAALAGVALAMLLASVQRPVGPVGTVAISASPGNDAVPAQAARADAILVQGDGLPAARWHDLPARPLQWQPPATPALALDFPRRLALGRLFTLSVRCEPAPAPWRLQLLDENDHLLAEAPAEGALATVRWLPPLAEPLLLRARVLAADGAVLAQGPVPLDVVAGPPLRVQGRFAAPSFDVQALEALLVASDAVVDWQVTLGKTVTRSVSARAAMPVPDLAVTDAAHFERAAAPARQQLLAQVAQGMSLVVLAGNASDAALWRRELQLRLVPAADPDKPRLVRPGPGLELPAAGWAPGDASTTQGPWTVADAAQPWAWQRPWQQGRVVWLAVTDWHRHAITAPLALAAWWQAVLDLARVQQPVDVVWQFPDAMPMPGLRTRICARGAPPGTLVHVAPTAGTLVPLAPTAGTLVPMAPAAGTLVHLAPTTGAAAAASRPAAAAAGQAVRLLPRADSSDAVCAAVWPAAPGWFTVQVDGTPQPAARFYVHAPGDWPLWQRLLRRDATARYAARALTPPGPATAPLPAWPLASLAAVACLAGWWRERR